jgi:Rad3-related DNA helicase
VPDGIVVLFPSYKYLEHLMIKWNETLLFNQLLDYKLIFVETANGTDYLERYKLACDSGRGAFLFTTTPTRL